MTRPTARVLALLEILQGGGTHSTAHLTTRLGVDERTVRRYIGHLLDLEVPVESVRGRFGGYRLAPGFRMPPLMLTDDEALAVLLGLTAGRVTPASPAAAAKVRRVLPAALADRLDALFDGADLDTGSARRTPEAAVLLRLAEAARAGRPVLIEYTDRGDRRSERTLHPYGIAARFGHWYVTGLDSASGELRTFRLDRIATARTTVGSFTVPADFDPAAAVLDGMAAAPWRYRVVVAVRGPAAAVRARLPAGPAELEPAGDGWVTLRFRAESLDRLPGILAALELPFVVREPEELRAVVRRWAERIAGYAAPP
ncbi:YafY family protein [Nocardia sp. NPDC050697]|uniref:helix-turn-helix transcriptional regulator n=1 Tax=Nocardia sp. NPDC050697 TaxID=3155158 RepID=UPI0034087581